MRVLFLAGVALLIAAPALAQPHQLDPAEVLSSMRRQIGDTAGNCALIEADLRGQIAVLEAKIRQLQSASAPTPVAPTMVPAPAAQAPKVNNP